MTDIETKWRKDRARLLVRVKAGAVPNEDSQEKYKLSLAGEKKESIVVLKSQVVKK